MLKKIFFFIFFITIIIIAMLFLYKNYFKYSDKEIVIMLDWTPNTNHTGIYLAKDLGYFKSEGLNVKIEQPPQESSTALVAAGEVDFAVAFQDFLAPALTSDTPLPVKAVAAISQHNTSGIICKKTANIQNFADLEFKKYSTFDNFIELSLLKYCMKECGGNFNNVSLFYSKMDNIVATLNSADAAWGYFEIEGPIAKHFGVENNFLFFKDVNSNLDFYTPILICNLNFIKNNSDTIKKVLKALSKGYTFASRYPKKAAEVLVKCVPELDYEIVLESQNYMSTQYINGSYKWGVIDPERWNSFYDWLFENKIINKKIAHNSSFTNEFLPEKTY